jgi:hypothetical protein
MAEATQRELGVGSTGGGDLLMGPPPLVTKEGSGTVGSD